MCSDFWLGVYVCLWSIKLPVESHLSGLNLTSIWIKNHYFSVVSPCHHILMGSWVLLIIGSLFLKNCPWHLRLTHFLHWQLRLRPSYPPLSLGMTNAVITHVPILSPRSVTLKWRLNQNNGSLIRCAMPSQGIISAGANHGRTR